MKTVRISANPKNGQVYTANKELSKKDGKEYGFLIVRSEELDFSGALVTSKGRSALKAISKEEYAKVAHLLTDGAEIPGKIVIKEALVPFFPGQAAKTAGAKGETCTLNGKPIYRQSEFTTDMGMQDVLIQHNNVIAGSNANSASEVPVEKLKA